MSNLNAVELSTICTNSLSSNCDINKDIHYSEITNNTTFLTHHIQISELGNPKDATIDNFINYGTIRSSYSETFKIGSKGYIGNLINYGTISGHIFIDNANAKGAIGTITNYGVMGSIYFSSSAPTQPVNITINNFGIIKAHADNSTGGVNDTSNLNASARNITFTLKNYTIKVNEKSGEFNSFSGNNADTAIKNSHLVINASNDSGGVRFKDGDSKIILDFGFDFELGAKYLINKIATNTNGTTYSALGVDFSRLIPRSDIYSLSQSGEYFIATLNTGASTIGNLYKANVRTMNNFLTISNSMIYPHKYSAKRNTNKRRVIRRVKRTASLRHSELSLESEESTNLNNGLDSFALDSNILDSSLRALHYAQNDGESVRFANNDLWVDSSLQSESNVLISSLRDSALAESWQSTLQSHETFFYDSQIYLADNQRQTRTIRTLNLNTTNPNANPNPNQSTNPTTNRLIRTTQSTQSNDNYYFILTPFVNHNLFFESGRYNLRGLEYGFLTAFSGKLTPSNVLGTHFMMSYGNIGDSKDKEFSITNINLNVGLNYKFDMIWDSYLKARGDFFYFLNQVKTLTIPNVKPNTLGFGVSVAYGKDFNFGSGGVLGVEGGIDYKALQSSTITLQNSADKSVSETYQKSLYNLIYVDLGITYAKYFNTNAGLWGLNAGLGIKGNVSANKLAKSQIRLSALNHSVDMVLDNDKILGYANLSGSYVLNTKDFDMEFSLAYYGNFGDRVISNGGGVEWRTTW